VSLTCGGGHTRARAPARPPRPSAPCCARARG
jgi:hypothetical protein